MSPTLYFFVASLLSCALLGVAAETPIVGVPEIRDADTIVINATVIRLYGIDAPEGSQTCTRAGSPYLCGEVATEALRSLVETQADPTLRCDQRGLDRYNRVLSECFLGSINLNAWLVEQGHALAYRQYSDAYSEYEANAASAQRGMWAGEFVAPWDYRRTGQADATTSTEATTASSDSGDGCAIKGNINREGERIYHTPDSPWYDRTVITPSQGERWFCTEAEAQAAGWRRAGQP
ncbi:MAG: thermonuclease family protein [Synechococcaceae cyanobacterium SM2_3_60]|nr:thermonuclease family protein [Synechococcaceae cyanobacterium SM2_3_60]